MTKRLFYLGGGALALVLAVVLVIALLSGDSEPEPRMDELLQKMSVDLVQRAVSDMRGKLPPEFDRAVLLHFQGHRHANEIERLVRDEINLTQVLRLRSFDDFEEQVKEEKKGTLSSWADKLKGMVSDVAGKEAYEKVFGADMPHKELKEMEIHGLMGGTVAMAEGARARDMEILSLTLWVRKSLDGKMIFEETYEEKVEKSLFEIRYFRHVMDELGAGWKLLIWLGFTLLFPLLTYFVPAKLLPLDSNKVNMALLLGYTVLNLVLVLGLMGFQLSGFSVVIILLSVGLSGFYNYGILTEIQDFA
jgi:hypothetical protein